MDCYTSAKGFHREQSQTWRQSDHYHLVDIIRAFQPEVQLLDSKYVNLNGLQSYPFPRRHLYIQSFQYFRKKFQVAQLVIPWVSHHPQRGLSEFWRPHLRISDEITWMTTPWLSVPYVRSCRRVDTQCCLHGRHSCWTPVAWLGYSQPELWHCECLRQLNRAFSIGRRLRKHMLQSQQLKYRSRGRHLNDYQLITMTHW